MFKMNQAKHFIGQFNLEDEEIAIHFCKNLKIHTKFCLLF